MQHYGYFKWSATEEGRHQAEEEVVFVVIICNGELTGVSNVEDNSVLYQQSYCTAVIALKGIGCDPPLLSLCQLQSVALKSADCDHALLSLVPHKSITLEVVNCDDALLSLVPQK